MPKSHKMNKTIGILVLWALAFFSCKTAPKKETDKIGIARQYYQALDRSDGPAMEKLLADSLFTQEGDYRQTFSRAAYREWVKWDAVFEPRYEILQIAQESEGVVAKISKGDKRIFFLHKAPIVTQQVIRFDGNKISGVETIDYIGFNESTFLDNRGKLLRWIEEHHPELNGFLYDQTESGGMNYLKAIELYQDNN